MNVNAQSAKGLAIPFDHHRLDRLMDDAGIDVVLATSKHNVQYLLGGHRADFFDYMDATGITRYLPVLVYPKGTPEKAAYIGHRLEKFQQQVKPLWTPETQTNSSTTVDAMEKAVAYLRKAGIPTGRIAAEYGFLPYDAANVLRAAFPDASVVDVVDRTGGGDHFHVTVVSGQFAGLSLVEQHKLVYAALAEPLADGTIHELRITTRAEGT